MSLVEATRESEVRAYLKRRVEAHGGEVRAVKWLNRAHAPDVLVLWLAGVPPLCATISGHPLVEAKRPKKDARAGQVREHDRLRAAGFEVVVLDSHAAIDDWLPDA